MFGARDRGRPAEDMGQPPDLPFRLLLATSRWAVETYFASLREHGLPGLVLDVVRGDATSLDARALAPADAVAVDAGVDARWAVRLARDLAERSPSLPVLAVLCCPHSARPWQLQELVRSGASVLDLEATPAEAVRVLESIARGSSVLHLKLKRDQRAFLHEVLVGREGATDEKVRLLELLAGGLPDHEIGKRMHVSPHTVKHRLEDLRAELGARNRIELAAWAGANGFYAREDRPVRVQIGRIRDPK
jgi:DNA-binding NarL/FixJ family response regulator